MIGVCLQYLAWSLFAFFLNLIWQRSADKNIPSRFVYRMLNPCHEDSRLQELGSQRKVLYPLSWIYPIDGRYSSSSCSSLNFEMSLLMTSKRKLNNNRLMRSNSRNTRSERCFEISWKVLNGRSPATWWRRRRVVLLKYSFDAKRNTILSRFQFGSPKSIWVTCYRSRYAWGCCQKSMEESFILLWRRHWRKPPCIHLRLPQHHMCQTSYSVIHRLSEWENDLSWRGYHEKKPSANVI